MPLGNELEKEMRIIKVKAVDMKYKLGPIKLTVDGDLFLANFTAPGEFSGNSKEEFIQMALKAMQQLNQMKDGISRAIDIVKKTK